MADHATGHGFPAGRESGGTQLATGKIVPSEEKLDRWSLLEFIIPS